MDTLLACLLPFRSRMFLDALLHGIDIQIPQSLQVREPLDCLSHLGILLRCKSTGCCYQQLLTDRYHDTRSYLALHPLSEYWWSRSSAVAENFENSSLIYNNLSIQAWFNRAAPIPKVMPPSLLARSPPVPPFPIWDYLINKGLKP